MATTTVPCPCCKGKGQKQISKDFQNTLDTLEKLGQATYVEIRDKMKKEGLLNGCFDVTIVHKRVARLVSLGLIKKLKPKKGGSQRWTTWVFERA